MVRGKVNLAQVIWVQAILAFLAQGLRERDKRKEEEERGVSGVRRQEWEGERGTEGTKQKHVPKASAEIMYR